MSPSQSTPSFWSLSLAVGRLVLGTRARPRHARPASRWSLSGRKGKPAFGGLDDGSGRQIEDAAVGDARLRASRVLTVVEIPNGAKKWNKRKGRRGSEQRKVQNKRKVMGEENTGDDKRDGRDERGVVKTDYEWKREGEEERGERGRAKK